MDADRKQMMKDNTKETLVDSLFDAYEEIDRLEGQLAEYAGRDWIEPHLVAVSADELANLHRDSRELDATQSEVDWLKGHVSELVRAISAPTVLEGK